jgi:ferredoxin-NADP reductase
MRYTVIENRRITPTVDQITLQVSDPSDALTFKAGQYAAISFRRFGRPTPVRAFSILSSPTNPEMLQFAMRVGGNFTRAMTHVKAGETVEVMGPFGHFGGDDASNTRYYLAGGIGITPFMSMVRNASERQLITPVTLIYSSQIQGDVPFAQELVTLAATNPNFKVIFAISSGEIDRFAQVNGVAGRITPSLIDQATGGVYQAASFYICGPPRFMKAATEILTEKGVGAHNIETESFSQTKGGVAHRMTRRVYAVTAATLLLTASGVALKDLDHTAERAQAYNDAVTASVVPAATPIETPVADPSSAQTPVTRVARVQAPSQVS